jgi:hypothetical protein
MAMRQEDKEKLMEITVSIVEDLANLDSEKDRMSSLKDYTRIVQMIQPVVSALVFEEKAKVREEILSKFHENLIKVKQSL